MGRSPPPWRDYPASAGELQPDGHLAVDTRLSREEPGTAKRLIESHFDRERLSRPDHPPEASLILTRDHRHPAFGNVAGRSDQHRPGLEHRFAQQHARQHRKPGIVPFEDRQVLGQPLVGPDGRGGQFHHFVKPKERITVRNQRLDRRAIQHHRPLALIIHQTFAGASSLSPSLATITP